MSQVPFAAPSSGPNVGTGLGSNPGSNPGSNDYAATLSRLRKKWLAWSAVPIILALAVIVFVVYTLAWNGKGSKAFAAGSYASAATSFEKNDRWLPTEQWIAPFNAGTALVGAGEYDRALELLQSAKDRAPAIEPETDLSQVQPADLPPVCLINGNMSVAYSLLGQESAGLGQPFLEEFREIVAQLANAKKLADYDSLKAKLKPIAADGIPHFEQAIEHFDKALELRQEFTCPDPEQIVEKLTAAKQAAQDAIDEMQDPDLPPPPPEEEENPEPEPENGQGEEPPNGGDQEGGEGEPKDPGDQGGEEDNPAQPEPGEGDQESGNGGGGSALSPGESDRREQLNERNKAGQRERDSTESYMGGYEYTPKNW